MNIMKHIYWRVCIFRYADKEDATPDSPTEERSDPPQFAETCMRELIGRASFGHIRCVIRPVLRYGTDLEINI